MILLLLVISIKHILESALFFTSLLVLSLYDSLLYTNIKSLMSHHNQTDGNQDSLCISIFTDIVMQKLLVTNRIKHK